MTRAVVRLMPHGGSIVDADALVFTGAQVESLSVIGQFDMDSLSFEDILRRVESFKDTLLEKKIRLLLQKHHGVAIDAAREAGFRGGHNATTKFNKLAQKYGITWREFREK